jgi:hypothetical protein
MKHALAAACVAAAALLAGCGSLNPPATAADGAMAGPVHGSSAGVWSSVLGYHGPVNSMDMPGGPN